VVAVNSLPKTFLTHTRFVFLVATIFAVVVSVNAQGDPHAEETARANALTKSGNQKMRNGDFDGAIADFNEVIRIYQVYPANVQSASYLSRGLAYSGKGELEKALADMNKAISLQSDNAFGYQNRAGVYEKQNEIDKAIADYSKAIKLNPKFPFPYRGRGLLLLKKGKDTEAEADFAKYLQLNPNGKSALDKQIQEIKDKRIANP
jgi:tetratricopeptide (TPR) repeat protein